jgi:hypothetical protein
VRSPVRRTISRLFLPSGRGPGTRRRHVGEGVAHGFELVGPIVVLTVLGFWLDGVVGLRPLLTIVLFLAGASGSFLAAYYRYQAQMDHQDEGKPWSYRFRRVIAAEGRPDAGERR